MSKEISELNSQKVAMELAIILADENVLYLKTKNAHWNVEGSDFLDKHRFFESQMDELDQIIDHVVERIRSIGHYAPAGLKIYLDLTTLTELTREKNDGHGFIVDLLTSHESIILQLRRKVVQLADVYHDIVSSDFVLGLLGKHEKMAWFLRSHLKNN